MCRRLKLNFKEAHLSSVPSLEEALHDGKEARSSATGVPRVSSLPWYSDTCLCLRAVGGLGPQDNTQCQWQELCLRCDTPPGTLNAVITTHALRPSHQENGSAVMNGELMTYLLNTNAIPGSYRKEKIFQYSGRVDRDVICCIDEDLRQHSFAIEREWLQSISKLNRSIDPTLFPSKNYIGYEANNPHRGTLLEFLFALPAEVEMRKGKKMTGEAGSHEKPPSLAGMPPSGCQSHNPREASHGRQLSGLKCQPLKMVIQVDPNPGKAQRGELMKFSAHSGRCLGVKEGQRCDEWTVE
ncbi:hypothetical protein IRJ41_021901 [Triplophysa rosa]|uniref:Uncharacterized protein n=1 Tax=Triplophysa rosa TaxID=992332 RepID=A0A9W7T8D4_TRIRA|nr:hypothetical protein IRJ41_021901 [Triplophysa rosa]